LSGRVHEKDRRVQILAKLARLEAVERRWLGCVVVSLILGAAILAFTVNHLELGHVLGNQPAQIPVIQFILLILAATVIVVVNLRAFIDYFALELHVERQIVIKKRVRGRDGEDVKDDEE
jgi:hypothetical protein